VAVPAGFDSGDHLPGGVSLIGPAFSDDALSAFASAMHAAAGRGLGRDKAAEIPSALPASAGSDVIPIVVVGAHLTGMPLNDELTRAGGRFVRSCRTQGDYRLFVLPDTVPAKPGLVRVPGYEGDGIAVEVWQLPAAGFAAFVARIPAPLGIGKITLEDGSSCSGFLCETHATKGAEDITHWGGWRRYVESLAARAPLTATGALSL
jgi:allophanate hydrolase